MADATETRAPQTAIADLEAALSATPPTTRPHEHAVILYRLGLAYAEGSPSDPAGGLRKALACYDRAAAFFDPRFDPVPHARVLNAAGAAQRALGESGRAAQLFGDAARIFGDRGQTTERAAALNNLALAHVDTGSREAALAACDEAVGLFDATSAEGRRGRAAALGTKAMALAGLDTAEGLAAAIAAYDDAAAAADPVDAPYHYAVAVHGAGTACLQLSGLVANGPERDALLYRAAAAFTEALTILARTSFPLQHAMAKHNLGLVHAARGGVDELRRALACFEDAVAVVDPRVHRDPWTQAYASLERTERDLLAAGAGGTRPQHFAALLAAADAGELVDIVQQRLLRLLDVSDAHRHLAALAVAIGGLGEEATRIITAELTVLMELPRDRLEVALRAIVEGHNQLGDEQREAADTALDQAVGDALGVPQRVYVRDFLYSIGWVRP